MRKMKICLPGALLGCALFLGCSTSVVASPIPLVEYSWSGVCDDCTGTATGTLFLYATYVPGDPLSSSDFFSFTYDGTNLLAPFTINSANLLFIFGSIPASLPGTAALDLAGTGGEHFSTFSKGGWCSGDDCASDFGSEHTFDTAGVPEPASFGLLAVGFLGMALLRPRRRA